MDWANLADAPLAATAAFDIPYGGDGFGAFMQGDRIAKLASRPRLARLWAQSSLALMDGGSCVARGVCVPFSSEVEGRDPFPDAGWTRLSSGLPKTRWISAPRTHCVPLRLRSTRRGNGKASRQSYLRACGSTLQDSDIAV